MGVGYAGVGVYHLAVDGGGECVYKGTAADGEEGWSGGFGVF